MTYERHERWSFWILASCGFLPAMAPGIFIAIGAILWPTVYVGIAFFSLFHSLSTDLPWIVVSDTWFAQFVFVIITVTIFTLLVFGSDELPAMLITYIAAWLLPGWMLLWGVAVASDDGSWGRYRLAHYNSQNDYYYTPKPGFNIPSFEINSKDEIIKVVP